MGIYSESDLTSVKELRAYKHLMQDKCGSILPYLTILQGD